MASILDYHLHQWSTSGQRIIQLTAQIESENNPVWKANLKRQLEQAKGKMEFHKDYIDKLGSTHKLICISGQMNVKVRPGLFTIKSFNYYLTGLTIEQTKDYFEKLVKQKWENLIPETISFKEIPVGIILFN